MNSDPMSDGFQPFPSLSAPKQKSWSEIRKAVRKSHRVASQMINHMPQHFSFRKVGSARRLYFLSIPVGNRENTLLYVDLPNESISTYEVLEWHDALEPFYQAKFAQLSKEEQLLRERKRQRYVGIASYDYLEFGRKSYFAFAASTCLFVCSDDFSSSHHLMPVTEVVSKCSGKSQIDPKLCPVNPDLLAFVSGGDLWVSHTVSGCEERLTFVHKGSSELASDPKTAGVPSFVVQEEFDRYTGYWWQTSPCPTTDGANTTYRILYEEVDESQVDILKIISPASEGASIDEYRYPKAGSRNAISTLRIVEFNVDANNMICGVVHRHLPRPLFSLFPTMEYLLKAGWIPDEPRIYFELIDRLQQVTQLVVMDVDCFLPTRFNDTTTTSEVMDVSDEPDVGAFDAFNGESTLYWIIYEERSDKWINVSELLYFLPQTASGTLRFIRGSEKSGFMHLYIILVSLVPPLDQRNHDVNSQRPTCNRANVVEEVQLTRGEWAVDPKEIWVDEKLEFVYFMGYKDTPLETHLYIVQIDSPGLVSRLTKEGFSHSVTMDEDCSMFVTVHSSISMPNACEVYSMNWGRGGPQEIPCCLGTILESHKGVELQSPELFSFHSSCGHVLHGMLYRPTTLESSDEKHPVLLFVYCGPQVQLVSNSYKAIRFVRLHTLADMGFVVVVIDGRGSCHRGKEFESHIRLRLGTVEIEDQIEGLQWLSEQHNFMDMDRVAVHGWSYGGYITLMALVQHPEIFKVAIAGAPVTSWNLYDTGYTERYMDLPANNPTGYTNGSLLKHVDKFPNEEGRLLIVQGLMDENVHFYHTSSLVDALVKACKPHTLQVYPNERHGIRSSEANEHYETMLISFLQRNL